MYTLHAYTVTVTYMYTYYIHIISTRTYKYIYSNKKVYVVYIILFDTCLSESTITKSTHSGFNYHNNSRMWSLTLKSLISVALHLPQYLSCNFNFLITYHNYTLLGRSS